MGLFKKKVKELKSDLHYKVKTNDDSTFDYQKNTRSKRRNKKELTLAPGDWVTISHTKHLEFTERKKLNWIYLFYIRKRSLFNLIFQIILMVSYFLAYGITIYQISNNGVFDKAKAFILKDIILFLPLVLLLFKSGKTLSKAMTLVGPNKTLRNKFSLIESITIRDKRGKKRNIKFDSEAVMLEDDKATYRYGDTVKINSNIFRFDLLIYNKNEDPLYKLEYYNVQVDFRQMEGILISKGKKLEHSTVEMHEYIAPKN